MGRWTQAAFAVSERRVARLLPIQLATLRYRSRRDPQLGLRLRLRELAANRVRFGYRRLTVLLRRESWRVNAKRIYRLYTEDALAVRTKVRKKIARRTRVRGGHKTPARPALADCAKSNSLPSSVLLSRGRSINSGLYS